MNEHLQRMKRLLVIVRGLSKGPDNETFLKSLVAAASELANSEAASLLQQDTGDHLRFLAAPWFQHDELQSFKVPMAGSVAGWVYKNCQPVVLQDAQSDARHCKDVDEMLGFKTLSLAAVPVVYMGQPVGVLEAVNKIGAVGFDEDDLTILETLASLAGASIAHAAMQQRVQMTYEEMAELERMKNDFIAITSHELRTPLGLILGHSTFLRELVGEKYSEQLDTIIRNATRLKEIVENLSSVNNVQSGAARLRRSTFSMTKLIADVGASFLPEAREKQVELRLDIDEDELLVEGDAVKITLALSNLVKNAIDFTDRGGHIAILARKNTGYIRVSIADDGIGIPAKDLPHIFGRFYQVESHLTRRHGGMGLGLSAAKSMIELHGGQIWAESTEGKGSMFTFTLPAEATPAETTPGIFTK